MVAKEAGWKVAKEVAKRTGIKAAKGGGKIVGRAAAILGIGITMYEMGKEFKENIEEEPEYKKLKSYQDEVNRWEDVKSCLGKEPYSPGIKGVFDDGGCINSLYQKKNLLDKKIDPDPETARVLLVRAIGYVEKTENPLKKPELDKTKEDLVSRLKDVETQLQQPHNSYDHLQVELTNIVKDIQPIQGSYSPKIYECNQKLQKTFAKNGAWALASAGTLGIVTKKRYGDKKKDEKK